MKKIFNKILFIIFSCSTVMPIVLFSGLKEWLGLGEIKEEVYFELFDLILRRSAQDSVNEDSARRIFESGPVQSYMPKWYFLRTKIGFMDGFITYSQDQFKSESSGNRTTLSEFCKVISMATTYRGYLNKPWVTGKDVSLVGAGAAASKALSSLTEDLSILAAFTASAKLVLNRLILQAKYSRIQDWARRFSARG